MRWSTIATSWAFWALRVHLQKLTLAYSIAFFSITGWRTRAGTHSLNWIALMSSGSPRWAGIYFDICFKKTYLKWQVHDRYNFCWCSTNDHTILLYQAVIQQLSPPGQVYLSELGTCGKKPVQEMQKESRCSLQLVLLLHIFCQVLVQLGKQGLYLLGSNSEQDVQDKPWPQVIASTSSVRKMCIRQWV